MQLDISIPALFFPAISLSMLAYNGRYLALADLIRKLHKEYLDSQEKKVYEQITVLHKRLKLILATQGFAILSFIGAIITMFCIYLNLNTIANVLFIISLLSMTTSLIVLFIEIQVSMKALKIQLNDMKF